jgi:hypothetical protein
MNHDYFPSYKLNLRVKNCTGRIYIPDFTLGSGWNLRLTLFTQWRSSAAKSVNNCIPVFEYRKLTRRVKLLPFENMAKMTSTVGASDFDSENQSVATLAEEQTANLVMPQDLSSCLQAGQIVVTGIPGHLLNDSTGNSIEEGWPPTSTGELGG